MIWIIVIILLIILAGVAVWWWQLRNTQTIHRLDEQVATLDTGEVTGLIRSIEQLGLAGASLRDFTKWQREYQQLTETSLADLQTDLLDAETQNKQFQFPKVKATIQQIDELQLATAKRMTAIRSALVHLKDSEADNRTRMIALRDTYQECRKTILAKSFTFGDALPALEASLQSLADEMTGVQSTNASGDHEAARAKLDELTAKVNELRNQVKALPSLINTVTTEFPAQLTEITQGYRQLTAQNYRFTEDVPAAVQTITDQLQVAETQIKQLDREQLAATTAELSSAIDALYAVMEKELVAKKAVVKQNGDLGKFIAHAEHQNHELLLELDHLNQSYTLTHDEWATANDLKAQIQAINDDYEAANQAIEDHTAVYSELLTQFTTAHTKLHDIEVHHQQLNEAISGLRARERQALDQLDQFERAIRDVRYEVSRHDLPGLPQPYEEFVGVVTKEFNQVSHDLNQIKIDMDAIEKQLIQLDEDISQLKDQSRALIDAAGMTEQLLQYANRYKTSHPDIDLAVTEAKAKYRNYQYQEAADTIATALEKVEPGSYQKVEDDYLNQKTASLF